VPCTKVADSTARYLPFGDWRVEPAHELTDQAFTGQKHNMDLGLYYYNARWYLPGLGRFASADTIVPDPSNPQQYNRYTYVLNNPMTHT
jgi:RHS repeat-associated protein